MNLCPGRKNREKVLKESHHKTNAYVSSGLPSVFTATSLQMSLNVSAKITGLQHVYLSFCIYACVFYISVFMYVSTGRCLEATLSVCLCSSVHILPWCQLWQCLSLSSGTSQVRLFFTNHPPSPHPSKHTPFLFLLGIWDAGQFSLACGTRGALKQATRIPWSRVLQTLPPSSTVPPKAPTLPPHHPPMPHTQWETNKPAGSGTDLSSLHLRSHAKLELGRPLPVRLWGSI